MIQLALALPFKMSVRGHQTVVSHLTSHAHCHQATTDDRKGRMHTRQSQILPRREGKGRSNGARPFGRRARNGQSFNRQWRDNFNGQQFGPQYPPTKRLPANPRCQKCGDGRHANSLLCLANNKMCMSCGRFGHFAKVCRQSRIQQP